MYPGCCLPVDRDSSPSSSGHVLPDGVAECPAHEHYALKVDDWTCEDGWMVNGTRAGASRGTRRLLSPTAESLGGWERGAGG